MFAAIADHKRKLSARGRAPSLTECLGMIGAAGKKHAAYFKQLNDVRNGLKHSGILPNTNQWATVGEDVFQRLSNVCKATLDISLEEIDESDLLTNPDARIHLGLATTARGSGHFKLALEEIGKALFFSLQDAPDVGTVHVGRPKAEDALKLTAYGVSANSFLKLQELLPAVSGYIIDVNGRVEPSDVSGIRASSDTPATGETG